MTGFSESLYLTNRFTDAVEYARLLHTGFRKGATVPYMAHLLGVASLVLEQCGNVPFPVSEDILIAALLHDAVEDEGGLPRLRDIEANFGKKVSRIVEGLTDSFVEDANKKQEWEIRKCSYIERLRREPPETLLVSAADKLYNARAILQDYREIGAEVWVRFKRGRKEQLWYFDELIKVYEEKCPTVFATASREYPSIINRLLVWLGRFRPKGTIGAALAVVKAAPANIQSACSQAQ
jgi:GTP pyrophosphokinase